MPSVGARRTVSRGGAAKPAKKAAKSSAKSGAKAMSQTQMLAELSGATGLPRTQIREVFQALAKVIGAELHSRRPVTIPGLVKITLKHMPATAAHSGINPFTKEPQMFKAKPARMVVKVRALKGLKDLA